MRWRWSGFEVGPRLLHCLPVPLILRKGVTVGEACPIRSYLCFRVRVRVPDSKTVRDDSPFSERSSRGVGTDTAARCSQHLGIVSPD
jgi:hypothetical protein